MLSKEVKGTLSFVKRSDGWISVMYELSTDRMSSAGEKQTAAAAAETEILRIDVERDVVTILPRRTFSDREDFLQPKYDQIETISLEGFSLTPGFDDLDEIEDVESILDRLPSGFVKDPEYGLGLSKDYRFIVEAVEEIPTITKLVLTRKRPSEIEGDTYVLNYRHFDSLRKAINRTHREAVSAASVDKQILAYNSLLNKLQPEAYPEQHRPYKKDTIFKTVRGGDVSEKSLSVDDKGTALKLVSKVKRDLVKTHPRELFELRRDLELITLEQLIEKLQKLMSQKHLEKRWQSVFLDNPFVLSLAFGLPIIAVGGQVSVGGRTFAGTGEKLADFVYRNGFTENITLIEIKTPDAKLLGVEFRSGIFSPSQGLVGTVNQILDQRYQLQKNISQLKENSRITDMQSYAIKCMIVIGTTPGKPDEKKSFELFRNNLNEVLVVTFDELLEKLRLLLAFLSTTLTSSSSHANGLG
jgi:Domain of unknown function (DUF4263)